MPSMYGASVPIAAVYKDGYLRSGENEVRAAVDGRKWSGVHSISQAARVDQAADRQLRFRIPAPISSHRRAHRVRRGPGLILRRHAVETATTAPMCGRRVGRAIALDAESAAVGRCRFSL